MKRSPWAGFLGAGWLLVYGLAVVAGCWLAYHAVGLLVRAWLWLFLRGLPYPAAITLALVASAGTAYAAWRAFLLFGPQSGGGKRA